MSDIEAGIQMSMFDRIEDILGGKTRPASMSLDFEVR